MNEAPSETPPNDISMNPSIALSEEDYVGKETETPTIFPTLDEDTVILDTPGANNAEQKTNEIIILNNVSYKENEKVPNLLLC